MRLKLNNGVANRANETIMGQMAYFPPLRNNPISSLARIQGVAPTPKDRRERRAVAESHQTANDIAAFLSGFRPAQVLGADGKIYTVEAKSGGSGVASTLPWSISMNGLIATIVVPICSFQVVSGPKPPFTISGRPVDHASNTANTLVMSETNDTILLECTVDDSRPEAINTLSVAIVAGTSDNENLPTKRYIPVATVDIATGAVFGPYLERKGITTARRGDRRSTSNMVWF